MRRTPVSVLLSATLVLTACGEHTATTGPTAHVPGEAVMAESSAPCPTARTVVADIVALFARNAQAAALARYTAAVAVVGARPPVLHSPLAHKLVLDLISFVLQQYWAGKLNGGFSSTTQQEVVQLVNGLLCWVGLPQNFTLANLSSDGASAVLTPSTPDTTVVTGSKQAGVEVDSGTVTQPVLVTIQRLPDSPGPLLTQLDQYPIYYQFTVTPDTGSLALPVTIGVCLASSATPPDPTRLRVAHNVAPDTMGSIEILPLAPAPFLDCTNADVIGLRSSNALFNLALQGWRAARSALGQLFSPERLMAASSGVGGTAKNFSPFGLVDTLLVMAPNAPTSQELPLGAPVPALPSVSVTTPTGHAFPHLPVSFAVTAGGGSLTGASTSTDTSGIATVGSWTLGSAAGLNTVTATGTPPVLHSGILGNGQAFNVTTLPPSQLAFQVQPSNAIAGATVAPSVQVALEDKDGHVVTTASGTVTLALTGSPAGVTLTGGAATTLVNGVATFSGLNVDKAGTYTLTPSTSVSGVTTTPSSASFTISAGTPTQLAWTQQPTNVTAGSPISPAVTLSVEDANGNVVTTAAGSVTLGLTGTPVGVTLSGGGAATLVNGVATFNALSINKVGTYTLTPTTSVSGVTTLPASASFTVSAGAPSQLTWSQQPSNIMAGSTMSPAVTVTVQDAYGNVATTAIGSVTLGLTGSPTGVTLSGGGAATLANGVATFGALSVDKVGTYTFTPSTSVSGVTVLPASGSFTVSPGAPSQLVWTQQPSSILAGSTMSPAVTVTVEDAQGNVVTSSAAAVSVALSPSGTLGGASTVNAVGGVATFSSLTVTTAGTGYTLVATSTLLPSSVSAPFSVTSGAAAAIVIAAGNNQKATEGSAVAIRPSVRVTDAYGNPVAGVTVTFAPKKGCGSVTGAVQTTDATGTATVGSWTIAEGTNYLVATASASGVAGNPVTFVATGTEQHRSGDH